MRNKKKEKKKFSLKKIFSLNSDIALEKDDIVANEQATDSRRIVTQLKTVSLLDGLHFNTTALEEDSYLKWISTLAEDNGQEKIVPAVEMSQEQTFLKDIIGNAIKSYNCRDFKNTMKNGTPDGLESLVPKEVEVKIY